MPSGDNKDKLKTEADLQKERMAAAEAAAKEAEAGAEAQAQEREDARADATKTLEEAQAENAKLAEERDKLLAAIAEQEAKLQQAQAELEANSVGFREAHPIGGPAYAEGVEQGGYVEPQQAPPPTPKTSAKPEQVPYEVYRAEQMQRDAAEAAAKHLDETVPGGVYIAGGRLVDANGEPVERAKAKR